MTSREKVYDQQTIVQVFDRNWSPPSAVKRSDHNVRKQVGILQCRLNRSYGFSSTTIITIITPPVCAPGAWSLPPLNYIVSPPFTPLSICTSTDFFSGNALLPLRLLHQSFMLIVSPDPEQSSQGDCICWIIGLIWRKVTLTLVHCSCHMRLPSYNTSRIAHFEWLGVSANFVVLPL